MNKLHAILTIGLPASGKSSTIKKHYSNFAATAILIDPDVIKEEKEDYNPKEPEIYHEWSKQQAFLRTAEAIAERQNLIIDGTGTNTDKMVKQIAELHRNGYTVELLYVQVSLETAIYRNSMRERVVPADVITEKYELLGNSFTILSKVANKVTSIQND
jgi:predicted ABC-type ATPase